MPDKTISEITEESTSRIAEVDGHTVHYNDIGSGKPLIMLHGAGPGASGWSNFKQNLPALAGKYRVLLIDHPGFGKTTKDLPETMPRSEFGRLLIVGLMNKLGIDKAHFVGNSWGGRTALGIALHDPTRVDRLVLMGTGGGLSMTHPEPSEGMRLLYGFFAPPGPSRERMEQLIRTFLFDQSMVNDALIDERLQSAMEPQTRAFYQRYMMGPDSREPQLWKNLEKIGHRTLLMWGRDDRTCPYDSGLIMLKRMPNARIHIFPRCGHWVQLEKRAEFDVLLDTFLTEH